MTDHTLVRPWRHIDRRKSRKIRVGSVEVGGDAPISVQTMTNTPTEDASATIDQIKRAAEAGADIVRVSCPTEESTAAMRAICRESPVPIVARAHQFRCSIRGGFLCTSEKIGSRFLFLFARKQKCWVRHGCNRPLCFTHKTRRIS